MIRFAFTAAELETMKKTIGDNTRRIGSLTSNSSKKYVTPEVEIEIMSDGRFPNPDEIIVKNKFSDELVDMIAFLLPRTNQAPFGTPPDPQMHAERLVAGEDGEMWSRVFQVLGRVPDGYGGWVPFRKDTTK